MKNKTVSRNLLVDDTSKFFIKFESIFGLIRLPILYAPGPIQKSLMVMYIAFNAVCSNIFPFFFDIGDGKVVKVCFRLIESIAFYVCGFILNAKFKKFYLKMGKMYCSNGLFKDGHGATFIVLINALCLSLLYLRKSVVNNATPFFILYAAPLRIVHLCESFFFGHLLNSFCVKLKYMMEQVFLTYTTLNKSECREKITSVIIKTATLRYYSLVQAFDILIECIQWQVFALIFVTTGIILDPMQDIATRIIEKSFSNDFWSLLVLFGIILGYVFPLIYLCASAIKVTECVDRFKSLLNALLYSKQFDKHQKTQLKTLLSLISNRPLNFSLMGMFEIDTTLLLKIIHFLFTYLFIILQFKKLYKGLG